MNKSILIYGDAYRFHPMGVLLLFDLIIH